MNITSSGNQSFQNKSRLLLSRTLALVLNPLSGVAYSVSVHDSSCEKIGKVFEDFKRCNKHGINVLLTDAIDDIDLVCWISPFTLLIHGSSEDMSTIKQAWIGRMLKPPEGFVIKDFGEISAVNMQQIPQSQFISICETLHQIITSLNENNVNATFECVMNRLSNCFESVVIPPLPAVGKSLDLLVKEKKLDIIEGSYFARNTQASYFQRTTIVNHNSPIGLESSGARAKKNQINKRDPVSKVEKTTSDMERPRIKRNIKILNVKKGMERKRNSKKSFNEGRHTKTGVKPDKRKKKKKGYDRQLGKPSYINPERNNVSGNEFSDGFSHKDTTVNLETEDLQTSNKKEKRLSFLAKLSRLFKRTSCEENELSSEACESESEHRLNEYHIPEDDLVKLVPDLDRTRKNNKELRKKKDKSACDKKGNVKNQQKANSNNPKRVDKVNLKPPKRRTTFPDVNSENQHKISQNGEQNTNLKTKRFTLNLPSSASSCSSSYECDRKDLEHDRKNRPLEKSTRNERRGFIYHPAQDIHSSWSETSGSFSNGHSSEYSSDTYCDLTRPHYSPAINDENIKPRRAEHVLNFASTQAICGDLELSTPSLNPATVVDVKQTAEHITSTSMSPMITFNDLERQSPDKNNSELQTKNMFQLIGIL